jgi:hypothetical protein
LVLSDLFAKGYQNDPFNDAETVRVLPLAPTWAEDLARRLLQGVKIPDPENHLAVTIAQAAENIPYYVHRLVFEMEKNAPANWTPQEVRALLDKLIHSTDDCLNLSHYRDRVQTYYPSPPEREAIFTLLDVAAENSNGVKLTILYDTTHSAHPMVSRSRIAELAEMLERDHYLGRGPDQDYYFASEILRKWWSRRREGIASK